MSQRELSFVLKMRDAASGSVQKMASAFSALTAQTRRTEDALNEAEEAATALALEQQRLNEIAESATDKATGQVKSEKALAQAFKEAEKQAKAVEAAQKRATQAARDASKELDSLSKMQEQSSDDSKEQARNFKDFGDVLQNLATGNIRGALSAMGKFGTTLLKVGGIATGAIAIFRLVASQIEKMREAAHQAKMERLADGLNAAKKAADEAVESFRNAYEGIDRLTGKEKERAEARARLGSAEAKRGAAQDEAAFQTQLGSASEGAAQEMAAGRARSRLLSQGFAVHGDYESRRRALNAELRDLAQRDIADAGQREDVADQRARLEAEVRRASDYHVSARERAGVNLWQDSRHVTDDDEKRRLQEAEAAEAAAREELAKFSKEIYDLEQRSVERQNRRVQIEREMQALLSEEKAEMAEINASAKEAEAAEKRRAKAIEDAESARSSAAESAREQQALAVGALVDADRQPSAYMTKGEYRAAHEDFVLTPYVRRKEKATKAREEAEAAIAELQESVGGASGHELARLSAELVVKQRELLTLKDAETAAEREVAVQRARVRADEVREDRAGLAATNAEWNAAARETKAIKKENEQSRIEESVSMFGGTPAERRAARRAERARRRAVARGEKERNRALAAFERLTGSDDLTAIADDAKFDEAIAKMPRAQRELLKSERERMKKEKEAEKKEEELKAKANAIANDAKRGADKLGEIYNALKQNLSGLVSIGVVDAGAGEGHTGP